MRDTLLYLGIRGINGVVALLALAVFTRGMTADDYGRMSLGMAAIGIGASVLYQWLGTATNRLHGRSGDTTSTPALLSTSIRLWAAISVVVLFAGALLTAASPERGLGAVGMASVAVGISAMGLFNLVQHIANAQAEPGRYGRVAATRSVVAFGAGTAALALGYGADGVLVTFAAAAIVAVIVSRLPIMSWARLPLDAGVSRDLVAYGAPHALTFLSVMILDYSDRFFISSWHGAATVAGYSAGYDLAQQTVGVLLNVFYLSFFPHLVRLWEAQRSDDLAQHFRSLSSSLFLMAGLIASIFIALSPQIAGLVFGREVATDAARIMPWVAIAIALGGLKSFLFDIPFQLEKRTDIQLRIMVGVVVANLGLNLALTPEHGALGAAWSAVLSFCGGALVSYVVGRRRGIMIPLGGQALRLVIIVLLAGAAGRTLGTRLHGVTALHQLADLALGGVGVGGVFLAAALLVDLGGVRALLMRGARRVRRA